MAFRAKELPPEGSDAYLVRQESIRNIAKNSRLGSIELYSEIVKLIKSSSKNGEVDLSFTTYSFYTWLPIMCRSSDLVKANCIREVVYVLRSKGYTVKMDGRYTIKISW